MLKKILLPVIENLPMAAQTAYAAALSARFEANSEFAPCRPGGLFGAGASGARPPART